MISLQKSNFGFLYEIGKIVSIRITINYDLVAETGTSDKIGRIFREIPSSLVINILINWCA